ncbi:MAG: hypothetical protein RIS54_892 [Verrucomicrobiota bacterium]
MSLAEPMKAPWRKVLLGVVGLVLVGVLLLLTAPVQTWIARRVLAANPEYQAEVASVRVGLRSVAVNEAKAAFDGATLVLPRLEADLSVMTAATSRKVEISRFVARGWTLDLSGYAPARNLALGFPRGPEFSLVPAAFAAADAPPVEALFQGVFAQLQLPVDFSLDGAVLEGTLILPGPVGEPPVAVKVNVVGGGLKAGGEGQFVIDARADFAVDSAPVSLLAFDGNLAAVMDSPRTFAKLGLNLNAQASGRMFPQGVQLSAEVAAARISGGENYTITLQSVGKRLLDVQANFPENSPRLGGVWRLDMRDTDVAPFVLGRPLPAFEAVGAGMFETDAALAEVHAAGRLKSTVQRLEAVIPGWVDLGTLTIYSEFDITQRDQQTRVEKLTFDVARPEPVLNLRALQPFEFDTGTGGLKVADPLAELLAIEARGLPAEWAEPFLDGIDLQGGLVNGRLVAAALDGGMTLRTTAPVRVTGLSVEQAHQLVLDQVDLSTELSAVYNPKGWQAALEKVDLSKRGQRLLSAALRIGVLHGSGQAVKATGRLEALLVPLGHQPLAAGLLALNSGGVVVDFSATASATHELQAKLLLKNLAVSERALPDVGATLRASRDEQGIFRFSAPVVISHASPRRVSDLTLAGTVELAPSGGRIEATFGGNESFVEDLQLLALALASAPGADDSAGSAGKDDAPFWQGWTGTVSLAQKRLHYSEEFELRDVTGTVRFESGALHLDGLKAGAGESGTLNLQGAVKFEAAAAQPYDLHAAMTVKNFDSAPLFRALDPGRPPQVEGRFNLDSALVGRGRNPVELLGQTRGDARLSSAGGVFRLLSADVASKVEQAGKIVAVGAFIGNVAGALGKGGKDATSFASKAQAVSEFSRLLTAIAYDQLTVEVVRDEQLNTALRDFSLIAPEMRLTGAGTLTAVDGRDFLEQPLALGLKLKARGRTASALNFLHALAPEQDALGYAECTLPLKVGGTLLQPDTSELQGALLKLAAESSAAGDLLNRLLGK